MPAGGYSFCTWLRAEDFQDQLAPGVEPKIYRYVARAPCIWDTNVVSVFWALTTLACLVIFRGIIWLSRITTAATWHHIHFKSLYSKRRRGILSHSCTCQSSLDAARLSYSSTESRLVQLVWLTLLRTWYDLTQISNLMLTLWFRWRKVASVQTRLAINTAHRLVLRGS